MRIKIGNERKRELRVITTNNIPVVVRRAAEC